MLLSMLFAITPQRPAPVLGPLGRPIQAWFLRQITAHNPEMGQHLHGSNEYTVTTLLDAHGKIIQPGTWLQPGAEYWFRVTSLSAELSELLLDFSLNTQKHLPKTLTLYKMSFLIAGCTLDPAQHSWAGQTTFVDLCSKSHDQRQVQLEFASPTAFRSSGVDILLPIPKHIFRSYWNKWNAYAPEALIIHDFWPSFVEDCIIVSELSNVNSLRWKFAEGTRGIATGFTGMVAFSLLPKHLCGDWKPYWDGATEVLNSLSQFAFYAGTGHHATVGMGQTRSMPAFKPAQQDKPHNLSRNKPHR